MRQQDVVHGGEGRQKVEFLEDETDFMFTQTGAFGIAQGGKIYTINKEPAGRGMGQTANTVEQSGFSTSGGADNTDKLS